MQSVTFIIIILSHFTISKMIPLYTFITTPLYFYSDTLYLHNHPRYVLNYLPCRTQSTVKLPGFKQMSNILGVLKCLQQTLKMESIKYQGHKT